MFLPIFLLEDEDIPVLDDLDVFTKRLTDRKSGVDYFVINERNFGELINFIYNGSLGISDVSKAEIEFDLRTVSSIFTSILNKPDDVPPDLLVNSIISYHQINPLNARLLMSLIR